MSYSNKLIVTEGVYCLEGEIIDIPAYIEIARAHGAKLMVDDAHAVGVIGARGGGSPDYHDCADGIDILMGCMDKAMGGTGGYLCGSKALIDFLRIAASASVLSSALTCAMSGAVIAAIDLIEGAQEAREGLREKSRYLKNGLREAGLTVLGPDDLPSVPLFVGADALGVAFADRLRTKGIFCPVMRWPAVPFGQARLRLSLMARHEQRHLDRLIDGCSQVAGELGNDRQLVRRQRVADGGHQAIHGERLLEERDVGHPPGLIQLVPRIAGHVEHSQLRVRLTKLTSEFGAVGHRHHHVGDEEVRGAMQLGELDGGFGAIGLQHLEPM